jgi:hypothetical protein
MKVNILYDGENSHSKRIQSAVSLINGCQKYFYLEAKNNSALKKSSNQLSPATMCKNIEDKSPDNYMILITEDLFDDNWFSHEYRRSAIITIGDWESLFAPPSLKSYVMYQIAQALIHFSADMSEEMALNIVHEPPVGCMYDMAVHKNDIKLGMVAGNLCPQCQSQLKALGTPQLAIDSVVKIVELVRSEALGRPLILDPSEIFVVMRFSKNDENDNAWKYGIKIGIEREGFKPSRADDHVESGQILEKVFRQITRSRLIIVKVDENNLNVYFELGLAMGLDKDVLLVSDSNLILNLPSDLKNWECLTYEQGNYEQLAIKVAEFLRTNYHE